MNKLSIETSKEIIACYDKILALMGEKETLSEALNLFEQQLDKVEESTTDEKVRQAIEENKSQLKETVLSSVIITIAMYLGATISGAQKSMQSISKNTDKVEQAVKAWMSKEFGEDGKDGKD